MTEALDKISQHFGTAEGMPPPERNRVTDTDLNDATKSLVEKKKENSALDYNEAHANLKELIKDSMTLLPDVVTLTREAQSSGMYLAAASFLKMLAELNKDLLSISQTKEAAAKPPAPEEGNKAGNTTVFIGTSEDVFRQFSRRKQQKAAGITEGEYQVVNYVENEEPKSST